MATRNKNISVVFVVLVWSRKQGYGIEILLSSWKLIFYRNDRFTVVVACYLNTKTSHVPIQKQVNTMNIVDFAGTFLK